MAPLLPSNTPRFRFHYANGANQHTLQVRSHESPASIGARVHDFLTALGVAITEITMDFVDFAPAGSDIFNPVTTGIEGNSYGLGVPAVTQQVAAINFIGRTPGGRRVRYAVFGAASVATNYRFSAGENSLVDAAIAVLVASGSQLRGIDDLTPVWKTYANVKPFDHWVEQVR